MRSSKEIRQHLTKEHGFDALDEMIKMIKSEVPVMTEDGLALMDDDGNPVFRPYLDPATRVTAVGKVLDKTYPALKATELKVDTMPTAIVDMMGVRALENDGEAIPQMTAEDLIGQDISP